MTRLRWILAGWTCMSLGAGGGSAQVPVDADLPPPGFGVLNQDHISVRFTTGDLEVRFLPLDERVLRLVAKDGYESLRGLIDTRRAAIDSAARETGITDPGLALVTFFALRSDARFVEEAGACSIVLELVPAALATEVSRRLAVPTIGIGAGPGCDGQVLVLHDMLGLNEGFRPRFLKTYADLAGMVREAARALKAQQVEAVARRAEQVLALWCLWMAFDGKRRYSEREVNEVINRHHAFGDHCLLRRELVEAELLARTPGGEQYRKLPARPDAETAALLRAVRQRGPSGHG